MEQPRFEGIDVVYKSKADNKDIRNLLEKLVPKAKAQMIEFSKQFKGRNDKETCKKIFNFLKTLTFVADGEEQVIKLPSALLKKRIGDCKSFSLLTASILENLKIPYTFVYASYNSNPIPQHVYVTTQGGCIIDAVYGKFNEEKKPKYKYTKNMNVRYLSGLDCDDCLMGKTKPKKPKSDKGKKIVRSGKTLLLSSGRALFLVLIKKNFDGIATKLSKMNTNSVQGFWNKVGGNKTTLMKTIKIGASKPAKKLGFLAKIKKIIGNKKINGIGQIDSGTSVDSGTSGAIISLATTLGASIGGVGGAGAGASLGSVLVTMLPIIADIVKQVPKTESPNEVIEKIDLSEEIAIEEKKPEESVREDEEEKPKNGIMKFLPFIAIGGALLYFITKKNKITEKI